MKTPSRPKQGDTYQRIDKQDYFEKDSKPTYKHNLRPSQGDDYERLSDDIEMDDKVPAPKHNPRKTQGDTYQHLSNSKGRIKSFESFVNESYN